MRLLTFSALTLGLFLVTGCGGSDAPEGGATASAQPQSGASAADTTADSSQPEQAADQSSIPTVTASLSNPLTDATETDAAAAPAVTAPKLSEAAQVLQDIVKLKMTPIPADLDQARETRRQRNLQIVDMATNVLRLTLQDENQQAQFNQGIGQLLEARFQLALSGTKDDVDQLYADVQALNDQDPESVAAAEGVYYLAKFAHTKARLQRNGNTAWFENFSRWAREFADRFPNQEKRAVQLLFGAGRSCEMHAMVAESEEDRSRLKTESRLCYVALAENWQDTSQGQEATAVLRRWALPGKKLSQFDGPTLTGGYVNADQFPGKVTVIYYWDSESEEFQKDLLPLLQKAEQQLPADRIRFIGVNLDEEELELEQFMETNKVPGQQVFFSSLEQRSWNSPLIRYWGVSKNPSVWLLDKDGVVSAVDVSHSALVAEMRKLF
jgi:hypothetical protein